MLTPLDLESEDLNPGLPQSCMTQENHLTSLCLSFLNGKIALVTLPKFFEGAGQLVDIKFFLDHTGFCSQVSAWNIQVRLSPGALLPLGG